MFVVPVMIVGSGKWVLSADFTPEAVLQLDSANRHQLNLILSLVLLNLLRKQERKRNGLSYPSHSKMSDTVIKLLVVILGWVFIVL